MRLAAALLMAAVPTTGQSQGREQERPACRDDRGIDRCAADQQRRVRELFGVRSIEEHQTAGDQVRRVFYVDGYGRDLVLIAFVRAPGRDPTLWVHYPAREGEARPEPLQVPLTPFSWNEVIARSASFHRRFASEPGDAETICLHAWVYMIEAVDRPAREIRRKTESACGQGPGAMFAWEMERIAVGLIPHCSALDHEQHRTAAAMLGACRMLHGDRLAAAEVLNQADAFDAIDGPGEASRLVGLFADEARIEWDGRAFRGDSSGAARFWAAQVQHEPGVVRFGFHRVEGEASDRVKLTGWLSRSLDTVHGSATGIETAQVEQIWVRHPAGRMIVGSATVGPWQPARPR